MLKLLSGGQTGVDRAALDAAIDKGVACGGWCPKGGWAEDMPRPPGPLAFYPMLQETPLSDPIQRTEWNVRDNRAHWSSCSMSVVSARREPSAPSSAPISSVGPFACSMFERPRISALPYRAFRMMERWIASCASQDRAKVKRPVSMRPPKPFF